MTQAKPKPKNRQPLVITSVSASMLLAACTQPTTTPLPAGGAGATNANTRCAPGDGATGSPRTIHEALHLINSLPHPVDLPCFLESLDRPLSVNATANTQSAQPAQGKRSPRVFLLLNDSLRISVVPGGDTLEFGEVDQADPTFSVKGEVHFPVEGDLSPEDAFSRLTPAASTGLTLDEGTSCGLCHDNERSSPDYPIRGAFASAIVRPQPFFAVSVDSLEQETQDCDAAAEPARCAALRVLFEPGDAIDSPFP